MLTQLYMHTRWHLNQLRLPMPRDEQWQQCDSGLNYYLIVLEKSISMNIFQFTVWLLFHFSLSLLPTNSRSHCQKWTNEENRYHYKPLRIGNRSNRVLCSVGLLIPLSLALFSCVSLSLSFNAYSSCVFVDAKNSLIFRENESEDEETETQLNASRKYQLYVFVWRNSRLRIHW